MRRGGETLLGGVERKEGNIVRGRGGGGEGTHDRARKLVRTVSFGLGII